MTAWLRHVAALALVVSLVFPEARGEQGLSLPTGISGLVPPSLNFNALQSYQNNAALQAAPTGSYPVYRSGFSATGDGGGMTYTWSAASCSLNGGAGDNGSQVKGLSVHGGCWLAAAVSPVDPRVWGADPTGATDSTAAIQAAANYAGFGTLYLAPGQYLIGTGLSGSEVLKFQHPIEFWCSTSTTLLLSASIGTSTDILHLDPQTYPDDLQGWYFHGCQVKPATLGGTAGRHLFMLDTSANATVKMQQPIISQFLEVPFGYGVTGGDFVHTKLNSGDVGGSIFTPTITDNVMYHCVNLRGDGGGGGGGIGDSAHIERNRIISPTPGSTACAVSILSVSGAGNNTILKNNISSNGGIVLAGTLGSIVAFNEIEQQFTNNNSNNSQLIISQNGGVGDSAWVHDNQFQSIITATTLQLTSITGIVVGQSVTNANLPGGCTVAQVGPTGSAGAGWIYLSCFQTAAISSSATIVVGGGNFTTAQAAPLQAGAIDNFGVGTVIGTNRFGANSASPLITNESGGTCTLLAGQYLAGSQTILSDSTNGCNNLQQGLATAPIAPAFSAGNFTANGAMTWAVTSGEVNTFQYQLVGKQMTVWFDIIGSTIAGTPSTQLQITIPGGYTSAQHQSNPIVVINNGTPTVGLAYTNGPTTIALYSDTSTTTNWTASSANAGVRGSITFAVQ